MSATIARHPSTLRVAGPLLAIGWLAVVSIAPQPVRQWIADICGETQPMFASAPSSSDAAPKPGTTVTVLSCTPLPHIKGKSVTTAIVDFPPLAYSPAHRHPGSVTAFVIQGTVRSQLEGEPPINYTQGQTWFEPPRILHQFAENPDPAHDAKLLAFFITDENCGPLTVFEPQG